MSSEYTFGIWISSEYFSWSNNKAVRALKGKLSPPWSDPSSCPSLGTSIRPPPCSKAHSFSPKAPIYHKNGFFCAQDIRKPLLPRTLNSKSDLLWIPPDVLPRAWPVWPGPPVCPHQSSDWLPASLVTDQLPDKFLVCSSLHSLQ